MKSSNMKEDETMNHIICKTKDREMVIDMALEKEITVGGVHMALSGDGRCSAFVIGGESPVFVTHNWRKVGSVCLKLAA